MKLPYVKGLTVESIIDEVYAKHEMFGMEEFASALEEDNPSLAIVLY